MRANSLTPPIVEMAKKGPNQRNNKMPGLMALNRCGQLVLTFSTKLTH